MTIVKVSERTYINIAQMTYVEEGRKESIVVHFDVGGGDIGGPRCSVNLKGHEAQNFLRWLDTNSENATQ